MGQNFNMGDLATQVSDKTRDFIQSANHKDLLDIVDTLRSEGVNHYVDLPQIIVCGSQSSGKSSTLESLSGIAFPTAEGLCTRFATELILRRSEKTEISVHIHPGASRTEQERVALAGFSQRASKTRDVGQIIEQAKAHMGLGGDGPDSKIFSTDVLRIESSSPDQPNLTIVDLPGLFGASDRNQSDDDSQMVQDLVLSYMKQRRSIILAVVTADNPFTNQPVTKFAREIDPTGTRTLGLITKPDKLDRGSESERYYVDMAQNHNVRLTLGWHVLRNKSFDTGDDTPEERDAREEEFFTESVWNCLDQKQLGVDALRDRLRDVLWNQIRQGLPGVKADVQKGIHECRSKLKQLGDARDTTRQKQTYLLNISRRLSKLVQAAIDGVYADQFFESYPGQQDAFERRLRANVQKILIEYADEMRDDGHALEIVEDGEKPVRNKRFVMRNSYLKTVKTLMAECRGRELPGTFVSGSCQPNFSTAEPLTYLHIESSCCWRLIQPPMQAMGSYHAEPGRADSHSSGYHLQQAGCGNLRPEYEAKVDEGHHSASFVSTPTRSEGHSRRFLEAAYVDTPNHIQRVSHRHRAGDAGRSSRPPLRQPNDGSVEYRYENSGGRTIIPLQCISSSVFFAGRNAAKC